MLQNSEGGQLKGKKVQASLNSIIVLHDDESCTLLK